MGSLYPSHNFIFREKISQRLEFIGDFDGLYAADSDPWGQSATGDDPRSLYYVHSRTRLARALSPGCFGGIGLEIGCGHGHVCHELEGMLMNCSMCGVDISDKAVRKARELFPDITFITADITSNRFWPETEAPLFDFVILSHVLWYVLHQFDQTIYNALSVLKPGGLFVISQAFLADQKYGREVADGFNGTVQFVLSHFPMLQLLHASYDDTGRYAPLLDGLMIFRRPADADRGDDQQSAEEGELG